MVTLTLTTLPNCVLVPMAVASMTSTFLSSAEMARVTAVSRSAASRRVLRLSSRALECESLRCDIGVLSKKRVERLNRRRKRNADSGKKSQRTVQHSGSRDRKRIGEERRVTAQRVQLSALTPAWRYQGSAIRDQEALNSWRPGRPSWDSGSLASPGMTN